MTRWKAVMRLGRTLWMWCLSYMLALTIRVCMLTFAEQPVKEDFSLKRRAPCS